MTTTPVPTAPGSGKSGTAARPGPAPRGHIGRVVAISLVVGLIAALLLAAAPFISPEEDDVTGAVLCGFALGWASLLCCRCGSPISLSGGRLLLPCSWEWVVFS